MENQAETETDPGCGIIGHCIQTDPQCFRDRKNHEHPGLCCDCGKRV